MFDPLLIELYGKKVTDADLISVSKQIQASLDAGDFSKISTVIGLANIRRMEDRMVVVVARITKPYASILKGRQDFIHKVKNLIDLGNISVTLEELGE